MTQAPRELLVQQATWEADGVVSLRLVDPVGGELPEWRPGAHIDLVLPSGLVRQYSLCGDPGERAYTVAVLRESPGRGGSREVHEMAVVGRTIPVHGPRNHFPLVEAPSYLFIAGGIGVTPILAMVRHLATSDVPWRLVYGGRSRRSMAFRDELRRLGGDRVEFVPEDEQGLLDLDKVLSDIPPATAVYCCGPEGLISAVEERCGGTDLHVERFSAAPGGDSGVDEPGDDFEVELRRSGTTVTVPPDRSILEVVQEAAPTVLSSCEEGFCGTCETTVLEGEPDHRDSILTPREREESRTMMICVGRSRSRRLVLDL